MTIYFLCPDKNVPAGGVKQIYRQVDILNRNGIPAAVLHGQPGARQTWFENTTRVEYTPSVKVTLETDFVVIPEIYGPNLADIAKGARKVIFNQNCYFTFNGYPLTTDPGVTPYLDPRVAAAMTNSEDGRRYLTYAFPSLKVHRLRYGFDPAHFYHHPVKKRQIAFMPRKIGEDAVQVVNILKFRNALRDFTIVPISNKPESEVAAIMRESLIFLSFNYCEGFGMPPVEAMACGCIVAGYPALGGLEYFKPEFSYPVADRDIIGFVKAIERVMDLSTSDPDLLRRQGLAASQFVTAEYSPANEERDILNAWRDILKF